MYEFNNKIILSEIEKVKKYDKTIIIHTESYLENKLFANKLVSDNFN